MEFLPIGSVVIVKGGIKKLVIIARAIFAEVNGEQKYFDYGACTYPEGLLGENVLYFQGGDITEVIAEGYADEDNRRMIENIKAGLEKIEKGKQQKEEMKN